MNSQKAEMPVPPDCSTCKQACVNREAKQDPSLCCRLDHNIAKSQLSKEFDDALEFSDHDFQVIVEQYYRRIYQMTYRMLKKKEDAEDITQETFVRAYSHYKKLDPRAPVFAWLCKIATNLCIDVARKKKKIRFISLDTCFSAELLEQKAKRLVEKVDLGVIIEMREIALLLNKAMNELPPHYCQVIVMRGCEGFSSKEVADVMGKSVSAIDTIFHRAKKKLREIYWEIAP